MAGMPEARRRFFGLRLRTLVWLILLTTVALSVYSYWSDYAERAAQRERELLSPDEGDLCTVILRGDALGLQEMPAVATELDGIKNYVEGRFVLMNDQWLKLDGVNPGDSQQWIPRENVLLIQVSAP
jgi:hypothetical protein